MLLNKFKPRKHKSCIIYKPTIMDFVPVIMAGGMGKRMRSDLPKVLHLFMGEPMLVKIIRTTLELRPLRIVIIVGIIIFGLSMGNYNKNLVNDFISKNTNKMFNNIDKPNKLKKKEVFNLIIRKS